MDQYYFQRLQIRLQIRTLRQMPFFHNQVAPETLDTNLNQLIISFNNAQLQQPSTCRICWQEDYNMVSPCLCIGSIQKVHQQCIIHWIQKQLKSNPKQEIKCEICKQQILYSMQSRLVLNSQRFCYNITRLNTCLPIMLLSSFVITAILSVIIKNGESQFINYAGYIVLICTLAANCIISLVILLYICKQIFTQKKYKIDRVFSKKQRQQRLRQQEQASSSYSSTQSVTYSSTTNHS